jgi:predicted RNA-binding Zn-ribbon protein involved in translation (DUF1610 family)
MSNWDKLWRCNSCRNINLDRDTSCSSCGRGYKEAGYTTVWKCLNCGNIADASQSYCSKCGNK